jgi:hypothetical protein
MPTFNLSFGASINQHKSAAIFQHADIVCYAGDWIMSLLQTLSSPSHCHFGDALNCSESNTVSCRRLTFDLTL